MSDESKIVGLDGQPSEVVEGILEDGGLPWEEELPEDAARNAKIRELYLQKHPRLSQREIGQQAGCSQSYVSKYIARLKQQWDQDDKKDIFDRRSEMAAHYMDALNEAIKLYEECKEPHLKVKAFDKRIMVLDRLVALYSVDQIEKLGLRRKTLLNAPTDTKVADEAGADSGDSRDLKKALLAHARRAIEARRGA